MLEIKVDNLDFSYQSSETEGERKYIFKNLSFSVSPGDFMGVIGPNGGGKSTLVKLLAGLLKPQRGSIDFFENGIKIFPRKIRRSYIPQHFFLEPDYPCTVRRFVSTALVSVNSWHPFVTKDEANTIEACLDRLGISHLAEKKVGVLSGGQLKKVLLARAVVSKPGLLILDEPAAGLDPKAENDFFSALSELNREMTLLIVSHDLSFVHSQVRNVLCVSDAVHVHETHQLTDELSDNLYRKNVRIVSHHHNHSKEK